MINDFDDIQKKIVAFRDARDWKQFHNSKDLAIALNGEASELLQEFLWKKPEEVDVESLREELADVLIYSILLADQCEINMTAAIRNKLEINRQRYPVAKARGSAKKYTQLK